MGGRRIALLIGAVIAVGLGGHAWLGNGADARIKLASQPARHDARVLPAVLDHVRTATVAIPDPPADVDVDAAPDDDAEIDTSDGLTDEQRWEGVVAEVEDKLAPNRGGILGTVRDVTGEELAGVTIIVTSPRMEGAQAAISDEHGFYAFSDLPADEYVVTFYYLERTVERDGVRVGAGTATPVSQSFIPLPGRTVEEIVIVHDDEEEDEAAVGVSFSGVTALENHYVIDGEDQ